MTNKNRYLVFILLIFVLAFAACGDSDDSNDSNDSNDSETKIAPTPTQTTIIPNNDDPDNLNNNQDNDSRTTSDNTVTISDEQRQTYEQQYEILRQAHQVIGEIWTALNEGGNAECSTEIPDTIPPQAIDGENEIATSLTKAADELDIAIGLWEAECQNPREIIPSNTIAQGWQASEMAAVALDEVNTALSE